MEFQNWKTYRRELSSGGQRLRPKRFWLFSLNSFASRITSHALLSWCEHQSHFSLFFVFQHVTSTNRSASLKNTRIPLGEKSLGKNVLSRSSSTAAYSGTLNHEEVISLLLIMNEISIFWLLFGYLWHRRSQLIKKKKIIWISFPSFSIR